jgi:hypothetical protein
VNDDGDDEDYGNDVVDGYRNDGVWCTI